MKIGDSYVPVAESGLKVTASDGRTNAKTIIPSNTADDHVKLGYECYSKKDFASAIADCTQAIKIDPNFALAYQVRAAVYRYLKRIPEAGSDQQKAKQLLPK